MSQKKQAILLADLGFGDAGKGTITDFLTRQLAAHTVVRYNGGPQAAHSVVTPDGKQHTFSQFGSGTLFPGTRTFLSRFLLINPLNMFKEERHLQTLGITNAWQRLAIDRRALVITPFQRAANRLREVARSAQRHGSCGEGIGECMSDLLTDANVVLRAGDLQERATIVRKLRALRDLKRSELTEIWQQLPDTEAVREEQRIFSGEECLEDCTAVFQAFSHLVEIVDEAYTRSLLARPGTLLFEGAQGVLLDENYGFAPYTTWSTTTFANAETLVREHDYTGEVITLGILRAYATRHGAGPFPTEDYALTRLIPDRHNSWNPWQQAFRVGHFDLLATRYALEVAGRPDYLAITNRDRLKTLPEWKMCTSYRYQGAQEGVSDYFEQEGERIQGIQVRRPTNLSYQEKLTQRLFACQPEYQSFPLQGEGTPPGEERGSAFIEEKLSVPIAISSYGPASPDKHCSPDFQQRVLF
ncbi:MAG: adenylosuccinate synthetase [Chloroflexota bacterium]|nr:adenylosuccinate synthetase [Chloroflexota bacterium]